MAQEAQRLRSLIPEDGWSRYIVVPRQTLILSNIYTMHGMLALLHRMTWKTAAITNWSLALLITGNLWFNSIKRDLKRVLPQLLKHSELCSASSHKGCDTINSSAHSLWPPLLSTVASWILWGEMEGGPCRMLRALTILSTNLEFSLPNSVSPDDPRGHQLRGPWRGCSALGGGRRTEKSHLPSDNCVTPKWESLSYWGSLPRCSQVCQVTYQHRMFVLQVTE